MSEIQPRKLKVRDASLSDNRIPRNLILMYGNTPYIQKAGLEWKANKLFGGAGYSIGVELIERDPEKKYYLAKATLKILQNGAVYENYGEAHPENANSMMQKNLLHLAITRAECRVLRMATACGYASYDEVMTLPNSEVKALPEMVDADEPATPEQIKIIETLSKGKEPVDTTDLTKAQAAKVISDLSTAVGGKNGK
ncbi:MAG: hypothetical protein A2Y57_04160 [Candidatus Woykebacteria bacterium RBG_13_40_7b]|uniref:Uncharacterized protein n=1 Tax=Candidatus Woykebacteria bacterium RBG_13_40_7b TaxID=1802594 RepID=A0A1G1W9F8_9BACT|nr:MAG: hypothetical protein A2Y57_04160 [Candidatus Woykebacteria bacterium RBG_13_40_7b]